MATLHNCHCHPYGPLLSAPANFLGEKEEEDSSCNSNSNTNAKVNDGDNEVKVSIYQQTTSDECYSIAVGIVHVHRRYCCSHSSASTDDTESTSSPSTCSWPAALFVKDRNRHESIIQATNYQIGALISSALSVLPEYVVVASYSIPRPSSLSELVEGSAAWQLWKRKERVFDERKEELEMQRMEQVEAKREYNKRTYVDVAEVGVEKEDEDEGEGDIEEQRPSNYDCWQLETAACYLPEGDGTCANDNIIDVDTNSHATTTIDNNDVDSSLRVKLRRAASRSPTGTLHLFDMLVLAQCCQQDIRMKKEGWDGCANLLVPDPDVDALTREEVLHLLENKLINTPEMEASVLFCVITAQPDAHHFNLAVREIRIQEEHSDDNNNNNEDSSTSESSSSWGIALVHYDTGSLPVHAGVHLDSCEYLYDGHEMNNLAGWEFCGNIDCKGYYYPTLLQLLPKDRMLSVRSANGILNLDGGVVRSLVEKEYAALDSERNMMQLGSIMEERIEILQNAVREVNITHDEKGGGGSSSSSTGIGLRELCFRACKAFERDWSKSMLDDIGETLVWMRLWAETGDY